mmetsp:Transcript_128890/g.223543  ORF Transcript_128890/g.223543 Transcript_128890/m.223543 type:complete len:127 (+) Transcript_128890:71-451(+)
MFGSSAKQRDLGVRRRQPVLSQAAMQQLAMQAPWYHAAAAGRVEDSARTGSYARSSSRRSQDSLSSAGARYRRVNSLPTFATKKRYMSFSSGHTRTEDDWLRPGGHDINWAGNYSFKGSHGVLLGG